MATRDKTIVLFKGQRMFSSPYVTAEDLDGKDHRVTISKVEHIELDGDNGKEEKGVLHFEGKKKPMICNKTNARRIARVHGRESTQWIGKSITIYPTMVEIGGDEVLGIRVRPEDGSNDAADATAKGKAGKKAGKGGRLAKSAAANAGGNGNAF